MCNFNQDSTARLVDALGLRDEPEWMVAEYLKVSSTMDAARSICESYPDKSRYFVRAEEQTSGRGRGGSSWDSQRGNLFCTLSLRTKLDPANLSGFSLVVGIVIAEVLEAFGVRVRLKWPNDLLLPSGQKVGGILIENVSTGMSGGLVHVGIGLNLVCKSVDFPESGVIFPDGMSLEMEDRFLHQLVQGLDASFSRFSEEGFLSFRSEWSSRASFLGETIEVESSGKILVGKFVGVGERGELLLERNGSTQSLLSANSLRVVKEASCC